MVIVANTFSPAFHIVDPCGKPVRADSALDVETCGKVDNRSHFGLHPALPAFSGSAGVENFGESPRFFAQCPSSDVEH
jgi:hypothetical protein